MDRTNGLEQTASTSLSVNVFTAQGKAMVGERPKPFGEHDAVLVDAMGPWLRPKLSRIGSLCTTATSPTQLPSRCR